MKKYRERRRRLKSRAAKPSAPRYVTPDLKIVRANGEGWRPDTLDKWNAEGDLRERIMYEIGQLSDDSNVCPDGFVVEDAVTTDPEDPMPTKMINSNWYHTDAHGILTPEVFYEDLAKCIVEFADTIVRDQNPWQPVRIYKDAQPTWDKDYRDFFVGTFDFLGEEKPFDVRVTVVFQKWEFQHRNQIVQAYGHQFGIGTIVKATKKDVDVHVARDLAKAWDQGDFREFTQHDVTDLLQ